jgi:hypothetical protein
MTKFRKENLIKSCSMITIEMKLIGYLINGPRKKKVSLGMGIMRLALYATKL